jgi:aspartyl-tRNA(Asn)/glutamyl-tRNA(Gln) amidotransferase subunit B
VLDRYEPVIGLEVHCQLATESKLFCGCSTRYGALPNHHACPVCLGLPGVLPVLNQKAVDYAVRMALAVGARINDVSVFARKQYFYPDLPKGYQITQYDLPYCEGGQIRLGNGAVIRLERIHLEEDAGKNVHGDTASYVDVNRAGIPLIEIVSKPDLRGPEDAADYLRRLHSLVQHLGISDGNMEEGSFRCDANVSLRPRGAAKLGTRCEIKNLNSFKNIERAVRYEILRQADLLDAGEKVVQQTLLFDAASGRTAPMRSKEESHDYRYFPDPDLGPLRISAARVARIAAALPELPEAMAERFRQRYGLGDYDAALLTGDRDLARYFEATVTAVGAAVPAKIAANWITSELLRVMNEREATFAAPPVSALALAELLALIGDETISGKIAKSVFDEMVQSGDGAKAIVERKGLVQISDEGAITALVDRVLAAHAEPLAQYRSGKTKLLGFFVGQVMKESAGKMNPGLVNKILKARLDGA